MSDPDDSFLARWSRRKQAARRPEPPPAGDDSHVPEPAAEDGDGHRELAAPEPEPIEAEPPEPLPSLEDLTASSDLAGFLRKGVPKALQNAALRRMWSIDPAIRDYVGPAEYAWDFNQPGSMAGFGPLEAKESVAEFLATMSRGVPADPGTAAAASEPAGPQQAAASSSDEAAMASPDQQRGDSGPAEPAETPQPEVDHALVASSTPAEMVEKADSPPAPAPPRHGGAVPR